MKKLNCLVISILVCISNVLSAQNQFKDCSAVFLNNKMVVNEYSTKGKCLLAATASGKLTVNTAELSETGGKAKDKIPFKIAIRDKNTKTLVSFSEQIFSEINIQNVMKKCNKGDHIVVLTTDRQHALPHNEILVM